MQQGEDTGDWVVFGMISNISDDGISDIELEVSILGPDDAPRAQREVIPALSQLPAGDRSPFRAGFNRIQEPVEADRVVVAISTFRKSIVDPLRIEVLLQTPRQNFEGGVTYLGYLSNTDDKGAQIRGIQSFILDDEGLPVDEAERVLANSSIEAGGRDPFKVEFFGDPGDRLPTIYVEAIPDRRAGQSPLLWSISDPQLFFTEQAIPYYLVEMTNNSFAPQTAAGLFTLYDDTELVGVLPLRSPAAIPARSTWFLTIAPSLDLPVRFRGDEAALRSLEVDVLLDPLASRGVTEKPLAVDLEIDSVETIGGSMHLKGSLTNDSDRVIENPVVYAVLSDATGRVVSANSVLVRESLSAGSGARFTISLWIPAGISANALEFDVNAVAIIPTD